MIKAVSISGFRGFGKTQTITFSIPDMENEGSGLSIITGSNNSGKTTIIESIRAFNNRDNPSFSEGKRNIHTGGFVELKLKDEKDEEFRIKTINGGGSSTDRDGTNTPRGDIYVVPSRRAFSFDFGKSMAGRQHFVYSSSGLQSQRNPTLDYFADRIFQIEKDKESFDRLLSVALGKEIKWCIEQRDSGSFYLKYVFEDVQHSSEGIGDGVWSIFTICAALYDAPDRSTVVIDEPELSIHPALQKRIMRILLEYSKKIQIIVSTHSPYFINWQAIAQGASLIRVVKEGVDSICYSIVDDNRKNIESVLRDLNNPHILGLSANEAFFLEDNIILVEGQEDVVIYNKIADKLGISISGEFFGWGVGGASKMGFFLSLFKNLGFKKIVAIFDGDKKSEAESLEKQYAPDYLFLVLKEDDVRDKKEKTLQAKRGITTEGGELKAENNEYTRGLFGKINGYFQK